MSDSPCTCCRSTRNGRLFYVYVNHYCATEEKEERRARLCQTCVMDVLSPLLEGADYREGNEWISDQPGKARSDAQSTPIRLARSAGKASTDASSIPTISRTVAS